MTDKPNFDAVVLAGSRGAEDPVARHTGAVSKAVAPVAGTPMLIRVLSALEASPGVARITVVGLSDEARRDPAVEPWLSSHPLVFQPGGGSPAESVAQALRDIPPDRRVLVTTADHALLRPDIVEWFLAAALGTGADAAVAMAPYERVMAVAGQTRRTVTRLRDGAFCGCNLFALLTPLGRDAVTIFQRLERHRKHPARMARTLGLSTMLKFAFHRLTLADAMGRLSEICGARACAVLLPFGEAAIDVDKPDDITVAESLLERDMPLQPSARGSQSEHST